MKLGAQCLALLSALGLSPNCFGAGDEIDDEIKDAFRKNAEALRARPVGFGLDGDPNAPVLLDREWSLMADWLAAYLNGQPTATAKEVEAAIPQLGADPDGSVIELSPHTFVVAASRGEIGTFFIVSQNAGVYRSTWNAKDLAATHDGRHDDLSHWSAHAPQQLVGRLGALSTAGNGSARFYVNATDAQMMAAPGVIVMLTKALDAVPRSPDAPNDYPRLGMLGDSKVEHQDQQTRFCAEVEDAGRYVFTLVQRRSDWFLSDARDVGYLKFGKTCSEAMRLSR
jgi:hypothetical protein